MSFRGINGIEWQPIPSFPADWLERPFEEEEIKKAIFECDRSRAPGPDGFILALFQSQWETVKDEILKVFSEFGRDGIIHSLINESLSA